MKYGKWWWARRSTALGVLALFLASHYWKLDLLTGDYSASMVLGVLPLADPLAVLQSGFASKSVTLTAALGALMVVLLYLFTGGRSFCGWICPLGLLADLAHWLARRLGIKKPFRGVQPPAQYYLLGGVLIAPLILGSAVWEIYSPVSVFQRSLIFAGTGIGAISAAIIAFYFFYEFVLVRTGWCRGLCPTGAFYGLLGRFSPVGIIYDPSKGTPSHTLGEVCHEPEALAGILEGGRPTGSCTMCGACVDNDASGALTFGVRKRKL